MIVLTLVTAAALWALATVPAWSPLGQVPAIGDAAPVTLRLGSVVVSRGSALSAEQVELAEVLGPRARLPAAGMAALAGGLLVLVALALGLMRGLRMPTQVGALVLVVLVALAAQAALLLTSVHVLVLPVGVLAIAVAARLGMAAGAGVGLLAAGAVLALGPLEPVVAAGLLTQALAGALAGGAAARRAPGALLAGLLAGLAAALVVAAALAGLGADPLLALQDWTASPLGAALLGGVAAGVLALLGRPLWNAALGLPSSSGLRALADARHPLYAGKSPEAIGRAQELAVLAAAAARRVEADVVLTRAGAFAYALAPTGAPAVLAPFVRLNAPSAAPDTRAAALVAMAHEALTALVGPREVASAQGATTAALRSLLEAGRLDQSGLTVAEVSAARAVLAATLAAPPQPQPPPQGQPKATAQASTSTSTSSSTSSSPSSSSSPSTSSSTNSSPGAPAARPGGSTDPRIPRAIPAAAAARLPPNLTPTVMPKALTETAAAGSQARMPTPSGAVPVLDEDVVASISTEIAGPTPLEVPVDTSRPSSAPRGPDSGPPALRRR
ncbi:MAG: hypothetical protein IT370_32445 [Deltaproteobacteria bacterium]|nr:hypothetical protein [Deltaproteobacteria bacterium]